MAKKKADLIVYNAVVYTVDDSFSVKEAFAVKDGKFLAIGTTEAILNAYSSEQTIDAKGKPIYPGFNDAHCHFYGYGTNKIQRADLTGTTSFEEVVERLVEHHKAFPSKWIEGRGWDQNDWSIKEFPDKKLLDEQFPNNPVFLIRIDGHAAVVNSEALKLAGIDGNTSIMGGEIILQNGEPTGMLIDNAMELIYKVIPPLTKDQNIQAFKIAQEDCFAVGLTSVSDAGLEKEIVELIIEMQKDETLAMRINAMLSPSDENIKHFVMNGPMVTDHLSIRSIKLYADGALGSRGARMIEEYSDDHGNQGMFIFPDAFYMEKCQIAKENNYQVNTHAIGDGGVRFVLDTYARFLEKNNDLRWRIEHAQVVHPEDFKRFAMLNVIPSVQPTHATSDMYWAEDRLGPERIKSAYAYKQLLEQNGWIPLGTDFPIESINPLYTFYAAVSRTDLNGYPDNGFQINDQLTREEALKGITIWPARAAFEENKKGSIEKGKFADFVILDGDIMTEDLFQTTKTKVASTYLSGSEVFHLTY
ncbi:MAG: amidohydrolase [Bacteroidales bacterium]|nr:amidohydrolase [Bacteroidales bacterium]MCF8404520.1 amidohydrolase [Bacteroidales bacterium]